MKKVIACILSMTVVFSGVGYFQNKTSYGITKTINSNKKVDSSQKVEAYVKEVAQKVKEHWPYMKNVWPGFNYENHNIVLFNLNNSFKVEKAWVINTKGVRVLTKAQTQKIEAPAPMGYNSIVFEGKPSIAISMSDFMLNYKKENLVYTIGTHEIVHFYYQKEYMLSGSNGSRSQKYPVEINPRLYRKMLLDNLCLAYTAKGSKEMNTYLGKAKFWLEKWKAEFQDEANGIKDTDIIEGQARYIEYFGGFTSKNIKQVDILKKLPKNSYFTEADSESYELGYVSGILLDRINPAWKKSYLKNNKTPAEILLKDRKAISDSVNSQVKKQLTQKIDEVNSKIKKDINNIIEAEANNQVPYLKINEKYMNGSFGTEGFYKYTNKEITSNTNCSFKTGDFVFSLKGISTISVNENGESYVVVPLQMRFDYNNQVITVKSDLITGTIKADTSIDKNGRTWYIVK